MTSANMVIRLVISLFSLLFLVQCSEEPDADLAGLPPLQLEVSRADSLMFAFGQAIRQEPALDIRDAFARFVEPEADFFAAYLLLPPRSQSNPWLRDSLLTQTLGLALRDSALFALLDTVRAHFPYQQPLSKDIEAPLRRLLNLFPDLTLPRFTAHANGYPFDADWSSVDQLVSLPGVISFGLHYFMGTDWPMYPPGIYQYQRRRLGRDHMPVALVEQIAEELVPAIPPTEARPLLHHMLRAGIRQELIHELLPYHPDSMLLHYSASQLEWAITFESANYKLLLPLLYETGPAPVRDYLADKAFTSELSRESAPRIGEYVGWKMVEAYRKRHPEVTIQQLVEMTDYELILRESRYKP